MLEGKFVVELSAVIRNCLALEGLLGGYNIPSCVGKKANLVCPLFAGVLFYSVYQTNE